MLSAALAGEAGGARLLWRDLGRPARRRAAPARLRRGPRGRHPGLVSFASAGDVRRSGPPLDPEGPRQRWRRCCAICLVGAGAARGAGAPAVRGVAGVTGAPAWPVGARVLVLGRAPAVLEAVMQELAELGFAVQARSSRARRRTLRCPRLRPDRLRSRAARAAGARPSRSISGARTRGAPARHPCAGRGPRDAATLDGAPPQVPTVDLDAYCARIGYQARDADARDAGGPARAPSRGDPVRGDRRSAGSRLDLAPAAVEAKLIAAGRGGYCFEHNGLFARVLDALGFKVERLAGRVRWMPPPGAPPRPRTHMASGDARGTSWLADVGFGGCVPTSPLRMDRARPQPTPHETFRALPVRRRAARPGRAWRTLDPLSSCAGAAAVEADLELANWFTATHPRRSSAGASSRAHHAAARPRCSTRG